MAWWCPKRTKESKRVKCQRAKHYNKQQTSGWARLLERQQRLQVGKGDHLECLFPLNPSCLSTVTLEVAAFLSNFNSCLGAPPQWYVLWASVNSRSPAFCHCWSWATPLTTLFTVSKSHLQRVLVRIPVECAFCLLLSSWWRNSSFPNCSLPICQGCFFCLISNSYLSILLSFHRLSAGDYQPPPAP